MTAGETGRRDMEESIVRNRDRMLRVGMAGLLSLSLGLVAAPAMAQEVMADWDAVLAEANGQTVNFYMWGGSDRVNSYVDDYVAARAAELGVTVNRVPADAAEIVNKVLGEKEAGRDEDGSVDLIWINGENFKTGKQAGLWSCGWAESLPNRQYVDGESAAILNDFGTPVDGCESPWGHAQFAFVYDSAKVPEPPTSMAGLLEWIKANPGMFTYPAPPDFTGSVFVRHVLYHANGGYESLLGPFDQAKFDEASAKTWEILNGIEPSLWRGGETYPQTKEELDNLFANGEVAMTMTYGPAEIGGLVADGIFPETTREFVFEEGTIGNNHFVTIPYNSPNKAGAMVVADILLSPEAQLEKADPNVWGDYPVIDISKTDIAAEFAAIPVPESVLPADVLSQNANPELVAEYVVQTEKGWTENVLQQ
jgi:putative spermidine/putrescine transport system substrate-binding protein